MVFAWGVMNIKVIRFSRITKVLWGIRSVRVTMILSFIEIIRCIRVIGYYIRVICYQKY